MTIRSTTASDLKQVLRINEQAFGQDDEAHLVEAILRDPSAEPRVSLMALEKDRPIGHILFSAAQLTGQERPVSVAILAPLAIVPEAQKQGTGGRLIRAGLDVLAKSATQLVFVLGHPDYYPRHGFEPAGQYGLMAPYPIASEHSDAWMVQALEPGLIGNLRGTVTCCDALDKPEYWQE